MTITEDRQIQRDPRLRRIHYLLQWIVIIMLVQLAVISFLAYKMIEWAPV